MIDFNASTQRCDRMGVSIKLAFSTILAPSRFSSCRNIRLINCHSRNLSFISHCLLMKVKSN